MSSNQKEFVAELKIQWKRLWYEKIDDKVRAEGIAMDDYDQLFIEKGTIIHATRDFKALNFKKILEQYEILNAERYISPDPSIGGWGKFVKTNITNSKPKRKELAGLYSIEKKGKQQLKKSGRGWLNI